MGNCNLVKSGGQDQKSVEVAERSSLDGGAGRAEKDGYGGSDQEAVWPNVEREGLDNALGKEGCN